MKVSDINKNYQICFDANNQPKKIMLQDSRYYREFNGFKIFKVYGVKTEAPYIRLKKCKYYL